MKNLVLFLFVLVAGVWVTEGQQSTEVPSVITEEEADGPPDNGALSNDAYSDGEYESVTEDPSVNNETVVDNDSGNSTTGESLTVWTPP
uniref:Secreted protein n=1 Tax=Octopus bimaculoides TaxID=37653 RepID=A0A0L8FH85_OCTBM